MTSANFDPVVPFYDFFKSLLFLGAIQRCQYFHLGQIGTSKKILVIGGGTGQIIKAINNQHEFQSMVYIDSSQKMINRAQSFIHKSHSELSERIVFQCADILTVNLDQKFDTIILPFVADCFSDHQLSELGKKFRESLSFDGLLILSDFYESEKSGLSKTLSRIITRPLYYVFNKLSNLGINDLPNFDKLVTAMCLEKTSEQYFFAKVLRSTVYRSIVKPV